MKNLTLYVSERGGSGLEGIRRNLALQVDNSLELGWRPGDLQVYTNFPFSRHGVRSLEVLPGRRPRTARMTSFYKTEVLLDALGRLDAGEVLWYHDADAYQLQPFAGSPAPGKDLAACLYCTRERLLIQGGSMFLTRAARPVFEEVRRLLVHRRYRKDEVALTDLAGRPEFLDRFGPLDYSYNLGDTDFELRYQLAKRPIMVAHFHLDRASHRARFLEGRNSLGVHPLSERFERLLHLHGHGGTRRVAAAGRAELPQVHLAPAAPGAQRTSGREVGMGRAEGPARPLPAGEDLREQAVAGGLARQ